MFMFNFRETDDLIHLIKQSMDIQNLYSKLNNDSMYHNEFSDLIDNIDNAIEQISLRLLELDREKGYLNENR